jgi:hypothetical protein
MPLTYDPTEFACVRQVERDDLRQIMNVNLCFWHYPSNETYRVDTSLSRCGWVGSQPPKSPDSGDFDGESRLELERSFCLKVPQNGGFRGREVFAMTDRTHLHRLVCTR